MPDKTLEKLLTDKESEAIRDEISTRVMELYAERRGMETQKNEITSTLEALHDVTGISLVEIERIAAEVEAKYKKSTDKGRSEVKTASVYPDQDGLMVFEQLNPIVERKRRGFIYHLIPYVVVNGILVYLNIFSTSFPWAIFPILGWGIGLVSHYIGAVYWPKKELQAKIETIKSQILHVLQENWPGFHVDSRISEFNGIYRLFVTQASKELLEEYLSSCDASLSQEIVSRISTQLVSLQTEFVKPKSWNDYVDIPSNWYRHSRRHPGKKGRKW